MEFNDLFTNRQDEIEQFQKTLACTDTQAVPALMYFGVAGVGKTWLLKRLKQCCEATSDTSLVPFAEIDCQYARSALDGIIRFVMQLSRGYGFEFKNVKLALAALTSKGASHSVINDGKLAGTIFEGLSLVPYVDKLAQLTKFAKGVIDNIAEPEEWEIMQASEGELVERLPELFLSKSFVRSKEEQKEEGSASCIVL